MILLGGDLASTGHADLRYDATPGQEVVDFCEQSYDGRLFDPLTNTDASAGLQALRATWESEGRTVVFSSGAYDLGPHANHKAYLKGMRVVATPYHYELHDANREGKEWEELVPDQRRDYLHHIVDSDQIKLVVSVDGDAALDKRKSGDPSKGNSRRPFLGWDTRARGILDICDVVNGQAHLVVDAVTMHDNQLLELTNTPHAGIMEIGAHVQPDVWAIFFESTDIIDALKRNRTGEYDKITPVVLSNADLYQDPYVGIFSTSSIARRVREATQH